MSLFGSVSAKQQRSDEDILHKVVAYSLAHTEELDIKGSAISKALDGLCEHVLETPFHSKYFTIDKIKFGEVTVTEKVKVYVSVYISITRGKVMAVSVEGFPDLLNYSPDTCLAVITEGHGWEYFNLEDLRHELPI